MVSESTVHLPMSTTQLAGHGISAVTDRLTPAGLGVLLLILAGLAASTYFLNILIKGQQAHLVSLLGVQERQMALVLETHDREFDALMQMLREESLTPVPPPAPPLIEGMPVPTERP